MESQFAIQRRINDIKNNDIKVQITGYIENLVENDKFTLNDKTGEINVKIQDIDCDFEEEDLVNVIGELIIATSGEKSIQAQFVQDMRNLNFSYYQKLYEIKKEILNK
jgi:uncharacterized protein YdeI (BOF family)